MSVRFVGNLDNALRILRWMLLAVLLPLALADHAASSPPVEPGIDVWIRRGFEPLAGRHIGLITNTTGRAADGSSTLDLLVASPGLDLVAIFTPEHAFGAQREGVIGDETHVPTGLPIYSLYGDTRRPTAAMLAGLEGLVFDIQDIGTRFYTYSTTLAYCMEAAALYGLPIVVLDRPNPIRGITTSGPVLDPPRQSFVAYAPVPIRHGLTIGELALLLNEELDIGADLTVVPVSGWRRDMWYDETGLLWVNPSPNIRNLTQALLYPAVGALETTNISVGRGTDTPFEWIGAPWMDALGMASSLNAAALPGVRFLARFLTPESGVHAGERCGGVTLVVTDRDRFDAGLTAVVLAQTLIRLHPEDWDPSGLPRLWGDSTIVDQLRANHTPETIVDGWNQRLEEFRRRRTRYLLYR